MIRGTCERLGNRGHGVNQTAELLTLIMFLSEIFVNESLL